MPKVGSLSDFLSSLDSVSAEKVASWLNPPPETALVENKLGNRLLYPQVLPLTPEELDFDLAVLREAVSLEKKSFLNTNTHKLTIPQACLELFPDLKKLIIALVDATTPLDITTVIAQSQNGPQNLGTIIKPHLQLRLDQSQQAGGVSITIEDKKYTVENGQVLLIPIAEPTVSIKYESQQALLLGRTLVVTQVIGGPLGLLIDLRN